MREVLEEILRLANDQSWSHAARMVSIKKVTLEALTKFDTEKDARGGKTRDPVQKPNPPPLGKVVL